MGDGPSKNSSRNPRTRLHDSFGNLHVLEIGVHGATTGDGRTGRISSSVGSGAVVSRLHDAFGYLNLIVRLWHRLRQSVAMLRPWVGVVRDLRNRAELRFNPSTV